MLLLTGIIAVAIGIPLHQARMQKQAREWLTSVRGSYAFEHNVGRNRDIFAPRDPNGPRIYIATHNRKDHPFPRCCISLLGPDLFTRVVQARVDTRDTQDFRPLAKLRYLRSMSITMSPSDQLDLSPLSKITTLERLHLLCIEINETRIAEIQAVLPGVEIYIDNSGEWN